MSSKKYFWEKDPTEIKTYEVNWVNYLDTGESLASHVIKAYLASVDKTSEIIGGNVASGTKSTLVVKGGEAGKTYNIGITATSSANMLYVQRADLSIL